MTKSMSVPFWSVMIPTFNPHPRELEQMLRSVLSQDPGPDTMQIEVVDDCSRGPDLKQMVRALVGDRVHFSQTPANMGLAGCWNTCIARARGQWVHILHQDDYVLPGFYAEMESIARSNPDTGLIAVRSFFVDDEGVILGVTPRVKNLEQGGRNVVDFFYVNPIECPGVMVQKKSYERHGNFRSDLAYTLDWEMWTRILGMDGGVISPKVLACYRKATGNTTYRLAKTGETLANIVTMHRLFAERYKEFDLDRANRIACDYALGQVEFFGNLNEREAVQTYLLYWRRHAPLSTKARSYLRDIYRGLRAIHSRVRQ